MRPIKPRTYAQQRYLESVGADFIPLPPEPPKPGEPPKATVQLEFHRVRYGKTPEGFLPCARPYEAFWVRWLGPADGVVSLSTATMRMAKSLPWKLKLIHKAHGVAYYRRKETK
jgi:hypothetical protein